MINIILTILLLRILIFGFNTILSNVTCVIILLSIYIDNPVFGLVFYWLYYLSELYDKSYLTKKISIQNKYFIKSWFYPCESLIAVYKSKKLLCPVKIIINNKIIDEKAYYYNQLEKSKNLYRCKTFKSLIKNNFKDELEKNDKINSIDLIIKNKNSVLELWQIQQSDSNTKDFLIFFQEDQVNRANQRYEMSKGDKCYKIKL